MEVTWDCQQMFGYPRSSKYIKIFGGKLQVSNVYNVTSRFDRTNMIPIPISNQISLDI